MNKALNYMFRFIGNFYGVSLLVIFTIPKILIFRDI